MIEESRNPWSILSEREVYQNDWIRVRESDVLNLAGQKGIYGVVHFKHLAIGIIPLMGSDTWLVGQFRFPFGKYSWEIPAGGGHLDEDPRISALRELKEETGLSAGKLQLILSMQLSNSATDEVALIYLATDLVEGQAEPTEDEELKLRRLPLEQAIAMAYGNELLDSLTVAGLMKMDLMMRTGALNLPQ